MNMTLVEKNYFDGQFRPTVVESWQNGNCVNGEVGTLKIEIVSSDGSPGSTFAILSANNYAVDDDNFLDVTEGIANAILESQGTPDMRYNMQGLIDSLLSAHSQLNDVRREFGSLPKSALEEIQSVAEILREVQAGNTPLFRQ